MNLKNICTLLVVLFSLQITNLDAQTITEIIDSTGGGSGSTFGRPGSLAIDSAGNVYVSVRDDSKAFKITPAGVVSVIIDSTGDGVNTLGLPYFLAVDSADNVYISGSNTDNVFKITPAGVKTQIISSAGDGAGNVLDTPFGLAADSSGNVYVAGYFSDNVFKITPAGVISEIIDATGDGANILDEPYGVAVDSSGNVYTHGRISDNAFKITPLGAITEIIDSTGDGAGKALDLPYDIAVDNAGNVYVVGQNTHNVFKITPGGAISEIITAAGDGNGNTLAAPFGVTTDNLGNVYVAAFSSSNAFKISPSGEITEIIDSTGDGAGNVLTNPYYIKLDNSRNAFVNGWWSKNVFKIALPPPAITSATYDAATGVLVVTGSGLESNPGASNDIDASKLTLTGEAGATYTLTNTSDVEITTSTGFTLTLSGTDKVAVDALLNNNGTSSAGSTTYNLAAADDFVTAVTYGDTSDVAGNGITVSNVLAKDTDGSLVSSAAVSEPVPLPTSKDTVGEAIDLFDFTLTDGGSADGLAMGVTQIILNVSGTSSDAERAKITWRLNGPDVAYVTGVYSAVADTITFSGLGISVANGGSENYTINAYFNDSTVTADSTVILSVDGDTDLTISSTGTQMGATSAITNSTGTILTDDIVPIISSVSVPSNSTYTLSADLDFTVNFNENVTANLAAGTPRLVLTVGSTTRYANYISGTGTSSLAFRYTVQSGDEDLNGIALGASIDTNGGTLRDPSGNDVNTTLNSVGVLSSVFVDAQPPTVAEVTAVVTPGNDSSPNVTFSTTEAGTLAVGGSCGSGDEGAIASGNITITLVQVDNATALASGTYSDCTVIVTDAAGNASNALTLSSFVVDGTAPAVDTNSGLAVSEGDTGAIIAVVALTSSDNVSAAAAVTYTLVTVPANGSLKKSGVALTAAGTFTQADVAANDLIYDHDGSETLSDSFAFTVQDSVGNVNNNGAANFTFNITVTAVNDAPTTVADTATTNEDTAVLTDVLVNDSDVDGSLNVASVTVTSAPAHGSTSVNTGTGEITYTPSANFSGTDNFSYTVEDDAGLASATTVVTVTVTAHNDAPVAVADNVSTNQDTAKTINVAANDTDVDIGDAPDASTIVIVNAASNGTAVFNSTTNKVDYTPNSGFSGSDSFTYTIDDSTGATSNIATVSISVVAPVESNPPVIGGLATTITAGNTESGIVNNGTAPYFVNSTNPLVAEGSIAGSVLTVTAISNGSAIIVVRDANGESTKLTITVVAAEENDAFPDLASSKIDGSATTAVFKGGVTADGGTSYFAMGSFSVGESIEIKASIQPEATHVDQQADIIVAVVNPNNPGTIMLLNSEGNFSLFDGVNMSAFATVNLGASNTVDVTRGQGLLLSSAEVGMYHIFVGYYFPATGELIYNNSPIEIEVVE